MEGKTQDIHKERFCESCKKLTEHKYRSVNIPKNTILGKHFDEISFMEISCMDCGTAIIDTGIIDK